MHTSRSFTVSTLIIKRCVNLTSDKFLAVTTSMNLAMKPDRKTAPRSVIITRGAPCLRTISSSKNFAISSTSAVGKAFVIAYLVE
ncbi:hypothetical protein TNCV_2006541 [Trichonephila clavipes]|nr:hypothetical protein TNCV_2006541 [Trichonephila clavipes]